MAEDMMSTLKGLLGDNAEENIGAVLSALGGSSAKSPGGTAQKEETAKGETPSRTAGNKAPALNPEALQYIGQLKNMVDSMGKANDARSNLLMSLKPYMRTSRQHSIDNAVRLLNISKISGLFKL